MTEMQNARQTTKCLGCGRKLKAKASVAQGRGPRCQARHLAAIEAALASLDLSAFTGEQVVKAAELIAENAIMFDPRDQHSDWPNVYRAVASDGQAVYRTAAFACTCKAGRYGRRCYHRAAALVLDTVAAA